MDYVNAYFPDILPEDVLKHYSHDARPEGDFGENVLYSERDPAVEKLNRAKKDEIWFCGNGRGFIKKTYGI